MAVSEQCVRVHLLDDFGLIIDGTRLVQLPATARRLLTLLALREEGVIDRLSAEVLLWPDVCQARSSANLRSAIWRIRQASDDRAVVAGRTRLQLCEGVTVDLQVATAQARKACRDTERRIEQTSRDVGAFSLELLPRWYDDWLVPYRERWNQARVRALESMARNLIRSQDFFSAQEAALLAVEIEPYRDSAQRVLIEAHIAEGNFAAALQQYQRFRAMLQRELGVPPSAQLSRLVQPLTAT